jgi:predicted transcriptional regulator
MLFPDMSLIKEKRRQAGLTQKQLAQETGISQSLIAKIESKNVSPSYSSIKTLFEKLDQISHRKEGSCRDFLNRNLISISSKDTIQKASDAMRKNAVSQLPVFENKRVVGNISEEIIYNKLLESGNKKSLFRKSVKEIMADPLPTISASTPIKLAMPLLKTNNALLLTEKDKIIGIITKEDIITRL